MVWSIIVSASAWHSHFFGPVSAITFWCSRKLVVACPRGSYHRAFYQWRVWCSCVVSQRFVETKRLDVQSYVHPESQHIRPIRRCYQKLGGRRTRWTSPRPDPAAERAQDVDNGAGPVVRIWPEENRAGMQERIRVQRYCCGASGVRRGASAAGRPAREHLPVAHQVRARQARAT